jgi:hypothetical protein
MLDLGAAYHWDGVSWKSVEVGPSWRPAFTSLYSGGRLACWADPDGAVTVVGAGGAILRREAN